MQMRLRNLIPHGRHINMHLLRGPWCWLPELRQQKHCPSLQPRLPMLHINFPRILEYFECWPTSQWTLVQLVLYVDEARLLDR